MPLILMRLLPYLAAMMLGTALSAWATHSLDGTALQHEKAAHAADVADLSKQISAMFDAAAVEQRKADNDRLAAEMKINAMDAELTREKQAHENDNRTYTAALAAGTQRVRVAIRAGTTSCSNVPAPTSAASVDDGAPAYADLDPAVASRVFTVAGDDQREIDKLKALQGYVCSVRPDLPACVPAAP